MAMVESSSSSSSSSSEEQEEEEEELPPPLFQAADCYFDAQELDGSDFAAAEALYRQAIAVCKAAAAAAADDDDDDDDDDDGDDGGVDGLMPATRAVGCPLRLPAVPVAEAEQSSGQLPPSAVLVSAAHNAHLVVRFGRTPRGASARLASSHRIGTICPLADTPLSRAIVAIATVASLEI